MPLGVTALGLLLARAALLGQLAIPAATALLLVWAGFVPSGPAGRRASAGPLASLFWGRAFPSSQSRPRPA